MGYHSAFSQLMPLKIGSPPGLDLAALLAPYPAENHLDLARGAGSYVRQLALQGQRELAREALAAAAGHPLGRGVVEGLCIPFGFPLAFRTRGRLAESRALADVVPAELGPGWVRGQGIQVGRLLARGIPSDVAAALQLARLQQPEERAQLWRGVGIGFAIAGAVRAPERLDEWAPAEHREACRAGFEAELRRRTED